MVRQDRFTDPMAFRHSMTFGAAISGTLQCQNERHLTKAVVAPFLVVLTFKKTGSHRGLRPDPVED